MSKHILVLAGDTDGNLGDLAIVTATCDLIHDVSPGATISILTSRPDRDERRIGIRPIRRGLRGIPALLRTAAAADQVICGGGGLFQDDDSLLKMPYWAVRLWMIRRFAASISGLSIGAGPLQHATSRYFARMALGQLDRITVRDKLARDTLESLTDRPVTVVPDPAFLLQAAPVNDARKALDAAGVPTDGTPLVGVAVRRWFHKASDVIPYKYASRVGLYRDRGKQQMQEFVRLVADTLDRVSNETGAHIVFLPTYNVPHEADVAVCDAIMSAMASSRCSTMLVDDPKLYKAITGLMSVMLCGRMHPAILASGQRVPIVALAYNPKFFGAFSLVGRDDRCVSIGEFVEMGASDALARQLVECIRDPDANRPDPSAAEASARRYIRELAADSAGDA